MEIAQLYQIFLENPSIETDTRKVKKGDIFFALKGPNFNGNLFAEDALSKGACYAVVDELVHTTNKRIINTEDVLATLQQLAKYHRQQLDIPFIVITGSNGKTTTKELVSAVLSSQYKTYTTIGNLNNHIGVPLTILSIKPDAEMAVIEMGANHQKEIESYCSYTLPTYGIITNCGKAHLEGFGGEEGVKKGKGELFDYLRINNGKAFVYWDFDYLQTMCNGVIEIIKYGTKEGYLIGNIADSEPFLSVKINNETNEAIIQTHLVGSYNLPNILCAVTVGKYFNIPFSKIKVAIENYVPSNSRSQLIEKDTNKIILDAYNANPSSMRVALENFANLKAENKVIYIGGMMELGDTSIYEHQQMIDLIKKYVWLEVILVGGDFAKTIHSFTYLPNATVAKAYYDDKKYSNSFILIKGSRSMQMETIIN